MLLLSSFAATCAGAGPLVSHDDAARNGLHRAWFAQLPVNPQRSRVSSWYLYFDRLYGVTDSGIIAALDAETGAELWVKQVGRHGYALFGPDANEKHLGVVSGSNLYLLDRNDGRLIWSRELGSAPSSGPALSANYAYVALLTGRIEGYRLDDPRTQPWYYQSKGRTYLRPTTTGSVVSWPTAAGYLYVSDANKPRVRFRMETSDDIVTSPAAQGETLYIASLDGYLYALHERTGDEKWRYSTGFAISSSPAIVGDQVFVASLEPALHAIDVKTGQGLWSAPGISHFAAKGADRVYASDRYGNLLSLDAKTGRPLGGIATIQGMSTLVNDQSNRIFLVNDRGLVQCLHEIGADKPTMYRQPISVTPPQDGAAAPAAGDATDAPESPGDEPPAAAADEEPGMDPLDGDPLDVPEADVLGGELPQGDELEQPMDDEPLPADDDDDPFN